VYEVSQTPFVVTIWPDASRVGIGEPVAITLRVVNATEKPQTLKVMAFQWNRHWKNNNPRIKFAGGVPAGEVSDDTPRTLTLEPGEAYEERAFMAVKDGTPVVMLWFQMGFTPIDDKKTYWSNSVILGIKPVNPK
jgi:hypothetical protein